MIPDDGQGALLFASSCIEFRADQIVACLDSLQLRLQQVPGYAVSDQVIQMIPYVTVVVILALVGTTRVPEAVGQHYGSGEEP